MENATLTISMPRPMKEFIAARMREGQFSTPSEYIRSLIRGDQEARSAARKRESTPEDRNGSVGR